MFVLSCAATSTGLDASRPSGANLGGCRGDNCPSVCGDGLRIDGEGCDDGNSENGDGCSAQCVVEAGYECLDQALREPPFARIPIVYRDFRGGDVTGGHPDFEYTRLQDRGIVEDRLGDDGKPVYASSSDTPTTHGAEWFRDWFRKRAGVNVTVFDELRLMRQGQGLYRYDSASFFPLDDRGWVAMNAESPRNGGHNFHFTSELSYWFEFSGGETLTFRGDDDVWVFINGHLAVDIGGVHEAETASVTLDSATARRFGLRRGRLYQAHVFQAERFTHRSSYQLTLKNFRPARSSCNAVCGDGQVRGDERCDDGTNDGSYGSCRPDCSDFALRCGDGVVQPGFGEECDDGNQISFDGCSDHCLSEEVR